MMSKYCLCSIENMLWTAVHGMHKGRVTLGNSLLHCQLLQAIHVGETVKLLVPGGWESQPHQQKPTGLLLGLHCVFTLSVVE